jgi:hypothetical protein
VAPEDKNDYQVSRKSEYCSNKHHWRIDFAGLENPLECFIKNPNRKNGEAYSVCKSRQYLRAMVAKGHFSSMASGRQDDGKEAQRNRNYVGKDVDGIANKGNAVADKAASKLDSGDNRSHKQRNL